MERVISRQLHYAGTNGVPSWCWLDIYKDGTTHHVVFTEPRDGSDSGMSVTNAAENVIATTKKLFFQRIDSRDVFFYERYVRNDGTTIDQITLNEAGQHPRWQRVDNPPWE